MYAFYSSIAIIKLSTKIKIPWIKMGFLTKVIILNDKANSK